MCTVHTLCAFFPFLMSFPVFLYSTECNQAWAMANQQMSHEMQLNGKKMTIVMHVYKCRDAGAGEEEKTTRENILRENYAPEHLCSIPLSLFLSLSHFIHMKATRKVLYQSEPGCRKMNFAFGSTAIVQGFSLPLSLALLWAHDIIQHVM